LYIPQITYKNYSCYYIQDIEDRGDDRIKVFNNVNQLVTVNLSYLGIGVLHIPARPAEGDQPARPAQDVKYDDDDVDRQYGKCAELGYLLNTADGFQDTDFKDDPNDPNNVPKELPNLTYNKRINYYNSVPNVELGFRIQNRKGFVNLRHSLQQNKKMTASPIIGILLDKHIYMVKFLVVQIYIKNCKIILDHIRTDTSTDGYTPSMIKFRTDIELYINTYKNDLSMNELHDYIIYVLVGRIVDTAITNFIKGCINSSSIYHTIKVLDQIDDKPEYSEILQKIKGQTNIDNTRTNLLNTETNFKMNLNSIIDDVYDKFLVNINSDTIHKGYELNYTDLLVKDKDPDDTSNSHIVYNYSYSTKLLENRCYKINSDIIDLLVKNNAQLNYKDIMGNTPLFYAIELQHIPSIKKLLSYNASVNTNLSKNIIGITPFKHALYVYKTHLGIMENSHELTDNIYKKIEDQIKIKYSDNILHQLLLMLNHHFYLLSRQYKKKWSYDKYKMLTDKFMLYNITDIDSPINKSIPLLTFIDVVVAEGTNGNQSLIAREKFIDVQIDNKKNRLDELRNQIQSLTDEHNDIINKAIDPWYQARINDITRLQRNLVTDTNSIQTDIVKMTSTKQKLQRSFDILNQQNDITNIELRIKYFNPINIKSSDVLYDKIFTAITTSLGPNSRVKYKSSTNLDTYRSLWNAYINDTDAQYNMTNLPSFINKYQLILLDKYENKHIDINEYNQNLDIINELYKNIINPFAEDYETLPLEYNTGSNYALDIIINILTHTIKHNICSMLYNVLTKSLTLYTTNVNDRSVAIYMSDNEYSKYITGIVDNIMSSGSQNESIIMKYIMETLPLRCVKVCTKIYEGDNDPDRLLIKINSLFDPISNMLMMNKTLPIGSTSSIIMLLDKTIYPYFVDLMELFIKEGKNMLDSYMRYTINESKQVEIIKLLSDKAKNEVVQ
jgi:uncharacterized protein YdhG (YjbR/CyaY superfamily)